MAAGAPLAGARHHNTVPPPEPGQLTGQQRVLHALDRLTFGPRPGDVAAVTAMGLDRWFEQQLHPESIDDSALRVRMAEYPAMQLRQDQLLDRFPTPQRIRQMMNTREPLPSDPVTRAIYADQIAEQRMREAKRAESQAAAKVTPSGPAGAASTMAAADAMPPKAALPGDNVDPATPAMARHEAQLYSDLEAVQIVNLPPEQRFRRLVAMPPEELARFRNSLNRSELTAVTEGLTPEQREAWQAMENTQRMMVQELLATRLLRDLYSERQLEAVMTDFWLNHFNVFLHKNQNEPWLLSAYEREVIRPHALGRFEDLLVATAQSPAMLMYLDNWQSIGPDSLAARNRARQMLMTGKPAPDRGLNENYARELMELHTLGVQCEVSQDHPVGALPAACGHGYTQQDVTSVAQVLTGWTIDRPLRTAAYQFDERRHQPGTKLVLGQQIREGGEREGLQVLHMLATSPATAHFLSYQLAVRFVSDTPPPALVDAMAQSYLASNGEIRSVLRTMFHAPEFWSQQGYRAKLKTPLEFVVSAARASGTEVSNPQPLVQALDRLGMPLYGMQTPNGYSWMAEPWVSSGALVSRMNFALVMSSNHLPGVRADYAALLSQAAAEASPQTEPRSSDAASPVAQKELALEAVLLDQPASATTRQTVLQQFNNAAAQAEAERNFGIKARDPELMAAAVPGGSLANPANARPAPPQAPQDAQAATMAGLLLGSPEFQRR
ncbi:MAG: DUF1800 domain-containing protein [Acidobacteriota bacterium]|nr:DUF1800 domain-containing protein [Acidobacteriota bacterium]